MPDDVAIEEAKQFFAMTIPDTTLYWYGGKAGQSSSGGIPFLVTEIKDPHRVTGSIMEQVLLHFDRHTSDPREQARFRDARVILVRDTINKGHANALSRDFLLGFGQAYRQAFYARQVYGTYSNGEEGILFRLNWSHPTHPGQHVTAVMIQSNSPSSVPPYPSADVIQDKYHYFAAAGGLQMSAGLVPTDLFMRALSKLNSDHKATHSQATQTRSTGDASVSQPDGRVDNAGTEVERNDQTTDDGDGNSGALATGPSSIATTSTDLQKFYDAVLDCFPDPACKEEICRFLDLDESKVVLQFRKTELLKMLCAAFPLDPQRAFADPSNDLSLAQLYQLCPPRRSAAMQATDHDIFWWGSLEDGLLPTGFTERLARLDASEENQCSTDLSMEDSEDPSSDEDNSPPSSPPLSTQPFSLADDPGKGTASSNSDQPRDKSTYLCLGSYPMK